MSEYENNAREFLNKCTAELEVYYAGTSTNNLWNEDQPRDMYSFIIKTPRGSMNGIFWDSINNTRKRLAIRGKPVSPDAYNILACLEKYEVGTMDDFMYEFGYEIKSAKDMANFITTYNAVVKEYQDLCRIFTPEQMEMLREIY
jgi:hypothetical protein